MAGKGPDLFSKTSEITFMTYVEKGVIEDLEPYIDRDIDKEKYWKSSLYAYAKDGKVYAIEPNFQISILPFHICVVGENSLINIHFNPINIHSQSQSCIIASNSLKTAPALNIRLGLFFMLIDM